MSTAPTNSKTKIMVIGTDRRTLDDLKGELEKDGCQVSSASSGSAARCRLAEEDFDVVVADTTTEGLPSKGIIDDLNRSCPATRTIILTRSAEGGEVSGAIEAGAFDYLSRPFTGQQLRQKVRQALDHVRMRREITNLRRHLAMNFGFDNIVGRSQAIAQLKETAARVAPTDIALVITGSHGTGKELLARTIHHHSLRRGGRFVSVDCRAVPQQLMETELFGPLPHSPDRQEGSASGRLEQAEGGTLFLAEVEFIPPDLQKRLSEFLQDGWFQSTDTDPPRKLDIRTMATSRSDLAELVAQGLFLEDLYYRLSVLSFKLPLLVERIEDIEPLVEYFLRRIADEQGRPTPELSGEALNKLLRHGWPGNVRELENTLRRAAALCSQGRIAAEDVLFVSQGAGQSVSDDSTQTDPEKKDGLLADNQRATIVKALSQNNWNFTQTAQELGIGRTTLWRKVKKYNLKKEQS